MDRTHWTETRLFGRALGRRHILRVTGLALLAAPALAACGAAPAAPTAPPPTAVPKPTIEIVQPTAAAPTTAPTTAAAAPTVPAAATKPAAAAPTVAPTAAAATAAQLPAQDMTVLMWDYVPHIKTVEAIVQEFKAQQPNLNIQVQQLPGAERRTKYKLLATAGTPPDVAVTCCGDVAEYGELGLLLNLDQFIARDKLDPKIYFEGSYWEGLYDPQTKYIGTGNVLALPVNFVFSNVYYNKDMLAKAKVEAPNPNWKWDDLVTLSKKLTLDKQGKSAADAGFDAGNIAQYGFGINWGGSFYDFVVGAGGRWVTPENKPVINSPETIAAIQFVQDLMLKHMVMPGKAAGANIPLFPTGKAIAMVKEGSWNYTPWLDQIKDFQWDVLPMPIGPVGKRIAYGGSNQFSSWKGVKNPDSAWAVLKWLASPEMTLKQWGTQGIPSVKASAASPEFPKIAKLSDKMAKLSAEAGTYIQSSDPNIRSSEWKDAMEKELDPVWEGKLTPAEGAKNAQEKVAAILARRS